MHVLLATAQAIVNATIALNEGVEHVMPVRALPTYEHLLDQAGRLAPAETLRLLEGLAALLRQDIEPPAKQSITELRGLGKEIWNGMDAQEYVDRERTSWDG